MYNIQTQQIEMDECLLDRTQVGYPHFRSNKRRSFYYVEADPVVSTLCVTVVQLIMPIDRVGIGPAPPCMF